MNTYALLLRGINVGGKNKLPMAALKACLEELGYTRVTTYLASGNVLAQSAQDATAVQAQLERALPERFQLDSALIRIVVLTQAQLQTIVDGKPVGFGERPNNYHSDVIFLMGMTAAQALPVFHPREGVDQIWPGDGVIYSQRLSARRTQSRLSAIVGTSPYQSMTIRTWSTTTQLLDLFRRVDGAR